MNTNDERKQLEHATSNLPEQSLDGDATALREGWRVLSAALEKNSGQFDEAAFLSKLRREIAVPHVSAETNSKRGGWMVVAALLGGALAASLLLVVALSSGAFRQQPVAKPIPVTPKQNNLAVTPQVKPAPAGDHEGSNWNWDDPLDSQISVAAAQMQTFHKPALPLDASISSLNYQLQQMAQDLDEGAL
ncbi:MAG: hypothetical protein IAF94_11990 [Pirellulaceae bacterium]|nr:hypothetical protein [Pirellulaceae bacterium]